LELVWKDCSDGKVAAKGIRGTWFITEYHPEIGLTVDIMDSLWALFLVPYGKEASPILETALRDLVAVKLFAQNKEEAMSRWSIPL